MLPTDSLKRLQQQVIHHTPALGRQPTAIAGFSTVRYVNPTYMPNAFSSPTVGITIQGDKRSSIAGKNYQCPEGFCLITSMDIPTKNEILPASADAPFLAVALTLNRELIAEILTTLPEQTLLNIDDSAVVVAQADGKVLLAFSRLLDLLDEPYEIAIMSPLIIREIHHRLLLGSQGTWLRAVCMHGSRNHHIAKAISWLKNNFDQPLQVKEMAKQANMAESTFFRNFKQITNLSPIQFQKQLRLNEAQRLILQSDFDVNHAAFAVGYESPTQFIREYKRCFGEPPKRDSKKRLEVFVDQND